MISLSWSRRDGRLSGWPFQVAASWPWLCRWVKTPPSLHFGVQRLGDLGRERFALLRCGRHALAIHGHRPHVANHRDAAEPL